MRDSVFERWCIPVIPHDYVPSVIRWYPLTSRLKLMEDYEIQFDILWLQCIKSCDDCDQEIPEYQRKIALESLNNEIDRRQLLRPIGEKK